MNNNITGIEDVGPQEAIKRVKEFMLTLPLENRWNDWEPLRLYQGFWSYPTFLQGIILNQHRFKPNPDDIFLCSFPKSGTTWLKALSFAIVTRHLFDGSTNPLLTIGPHHCVPFLCGAADQKSVTRNPGIPLVAFHEPYHCLPKSVLDPVCRNKIVYISREPKDTFVSLFHFANKRRPKEKKPVSLEEAFDLFCQGISFFGPVWESISSYWKASQEWPEKVMFLKYEDLMNDTEFHVKKLAQFMGYPFSFEEEENGEVKKLVDLCSFDHLSNLEVNNVGKLLEIDDEGTNKYFFRKGKIGDWQNYLTHEMAHRLDKIMEQKLSGTGLSFSTTEST